MTRPVPAPCGTWQGYRRHRRAGEETDQACRDAWQAYKAEAARLKRPHADTPATTPAAAAKVKAVKPPPKPKPKPEDPWDEGTVTARIKAEHDRMVSMAAADADDVVGPSVLELGPGKVDTLARLRWSLEIIEESISLVSVKDPSRLGPLTREHRETLVKIETLEKPTVAAAPADDLSAFRGRRRGVASGE